ncbi:MAG: rhamnulokinase [Planctomycetaceae bacterium]|nr:rhamnulokinase [Planctomycetales bacterium]MCB9874075.1 rhamnulokinase [Planctomycetaceae bacterium]MCB9937671.1 rhamnulokinase [Planctomycetaceae bacterium]
MTNSSKVYLAVDLGASSGRVVAGLFDGKRLQLEDVHRFENGGIRANDRMYWDLLALWQNITDGLRASAVRYCDRVASVGVDTWGVDYGLLGPGDELLGNPYHYRDARTNHVMEQAFEVVSREEIFAETGLQFMQFNTLFQLIAMKQQNPQLLDTAESFLMMPDLFHWLLTGEKANEFTNASTSQFHNPAKNAWSESLFDRFNLPKNILGTVLTPGTRLGGLRPSVSEATGLRDVSVILPGTHDTASAVMAVPAVGTPTEHPNWCYISSGTWSLMGAEIPAPVISDRCRELNFTNEGGVGGTTRLLKNIGGLWLVQECRRIWKQEGHELGWSELVDRATTATPLVSLINPDAGEFVAPNNMPQAIREFCRTSGQEPPESVGAVIRCALESLALRYRMVLNWTTELTGSNIDTIHIVGGGTQNRLLCQMAADACNCQVVAGPVEATAIGNVMMQVVSSGEVSSIEQAREVVRNSFDVEEYAPQQTQRWDDAYARFEKLV